MFAACVAPALFSALRLSQAGGGEKKRLKEAVETRHLYLSITAALYVLFFTVRVLWQFSTFTASSLVFLLLLSAVNYLCLTSTFQALQYGTPYSAYQDVLFVNWAVMALSMVTQYACVLWLVIPAYVLYAYGGTIWGWIRMALGSRGGGPTGADAEASEAEKKRLAKKERQAERAQRLSGGRG